MTKKTPNRAEEMAYQAMQKAFEQDLLRLYLDYAKLNRPGSPVYDPWESLLPILVPVMIGLILILSAGIFFGLLFIIVMILIYSTYFKKKIYRRLIDRTKKFLTSNYENCQMLWEYGGIVLVNTTDKNIGCVSPEGNWKEFIVNNYPDFLLEKKPAPQAEDKNEQSA